MENYFGYTVGHCNEKQKARALSCYKRKNSRNTKFSLLPSIFLENTTIAVYKYRNYRILGIVFSLKLQVSQKNIISSQTYWTWQEHWEITKKIKNHLKCLAHLSNTSSHSVGLPCSLLSLQCPALWLKE